MVLGARLDVSIVGLDMSGSTLKIFLNHLGHGDFHFLAISEFSLLISIMAPTFRLRSVWTER